MSAVLALVSRMRHEGYSRNRDQAAFDADADATQARRIHRWLRSLERDVASAPDGAVLTVEPHGDGRRVTLVVPTLRARRVAVLSDAEYRMLCEHPTAGALLSRAELADQGACGPSRS